MPFKKGNTYGANKFHEIPINKNHMIGFRGYEGREKLKAIPNWKERRGRFVDELIAETRNHRKMARFTEVSLIFGRSVQPLFHYSACSMLAADG